ncbi:hypothetical protein L0P02_13060, partial [Bifidobacterium longum]|nr:hypothetical protein [Bifidobacterium longum]
PSDRRDLLGLCQIVLLKINSLLQNEVGIFYCFIVDKCNLKVQTDYINNYMCKQKGGSTNA